MEHLRVQPRIVNINEGRTLMKNNNRAKGEAGNSKP